MSTQGSSEHVWPQNRETDPIENQCIASDSAERSSSKRPVPGTFTPRSKEQVAASMYSSGILVFVALSWGESCTYDTSVCQWCVREVLTSIQIVMLHSNRAYQSDDIQVSSGLEFYFSSVICPISMGLFGCPCSLVNAISGAAYSVCATCFPLLQLSLRHRRSRRVRIEGAMRHT